MSSATNYGYCNICDGKVPVTHRVRDEKVYLVKICRECGENEVLISSDASQFYRKQSLDDDVSYEECVLDCSACQRCPIPRVVLLEVTNRCNLNCPICMSSVSKVGFHFEPPIEYFDRIFRYFAERDPRPHVQLFGGEPTMRDDLPDIILLGMKHGLTVEVVTNGLRLADEAYCRELLSTGTRIRFQFDGTRAETYGLLRGSADSLSKKLEALENIKKYTKTHVVLICTISRGINDEDLPDLLKFCHERRDFISALYLVPLAQAWDPGDVAFNWDKESYLTSEDIERIVLESIGKREADFVPAGALEVPRPFRWITKHLTPFQGVHPNCESIYFLVSMDGAYAPISQFLKTSFFELICDMREADRRIAQLTDSVNYSSRGQSSILAGVRNVTKKGILYLRYCALIHKHVDMDELMRAQGLKKFMRLGLILCSLPLRNRRRKIFRKVTGLGPILRLIVIPYEDRLKEESHHLTRCQTAVGFIDPDTDTIRTIPLCTWSSYRTEILQRIGTAL